MNDSSLSRGIPGDPCPVLLEHVPQTAVGQLGDDHQRPGNHFDPFDRQNQRMPDVLDPLAVAPAEFGVCAAEVDPAVDHLDRLGEAARRLGSPDFPETSAADQFGRRSR